MIVVRLMGGLGNQMFQYATLLAVAKTRGVPFGVSFGNTSDNDYQHFCLPGVFPDLTARDCTAAGPPGSRSCATWGSRSTAPRRSR